MLGTIDHAHVHEVIDALVGGDGARLLRCVQHASEFTVDFPDLLDELIAALQRIAVAQLVPEAIDQSRGDADRIAAFAGVLEPEAVQLYYQIALLGRRDLPLAPDPRTGIEMILLRMLAFRPASMDAPMTPAADPVKPAKTAKAANTSHPAVTAAAPGRGKPAADGKGWESLMDAMNLQGMVRELAANCVLIEHGDTLIRLQLDKAHAHLHSKVLEDRLREALRKHLARDLGLEILIGDSGDAATPAGRRKKQDQDRLDAAIAALEEDAEVRALKDTFNARIVPGSVQPVE